MRVCEVMTRNQPNHTRLRQYVMKAEKRVQTQMATDKSAPSPFRRAQEFDQFGKNLDSVLGREMIIRRYSISERPITDRETKERSDRPFVNIYLNELSDYNAETNEFTVDPTVYHAWSEPLANKLAQINDSEFPLLIKFVKVPGAQGNVLTFE